MIGKKIEDTFNQQLKLKLDSYYLYRSMANYFHSIRLDRMAHWMKAQAGGKQGHVVRLIEYLKEQNSKMQLLVLSQPKVEWASPLEVFEEAFQHEQFITGKINVLIFCN
jgi:ferritin